MKRLTCEMCGSTDIMKEDGVFVCQTCGTKYSVEEAKKMMVEIEGPIQVQNAAQLDNLLNMARQSFQSKNFAKAEDFCNQVIAMDDKNYEAWKLKGEAINYQIRVDNPRILEVYNCIMTSFRVLSDEEKAIKKIEVVQSLKACMQGEIKFWLEQFESRRPSDSALKDVKNTFLDCYEKMSSAFDELGYTDIKKGYLTNLKNFFIGKSNAICNSAWKTTVGYNYYRDYMDKGIDPFGRSEKDKQWIIKNTDLYRPTKNIWDTFLNEADNLIYLLQFAETFFNDETDPTIMEAIYSNIIFIEEHVIPSGSWKITQGLGSTWDNLSVGWHEEYSLAEGAKQARTRIIENYKDKTEKLLTSEKEKRKEKYWAEHPEEKKKLKEELEKTEKAIDELQKQYDAIPESKTVEAFKKQLKTLEDRKQNLGLFKTKEKKAIQDQIDMLHRKYDPIEAEFNRKADAISQKMDELSKGAVRIREEFEKER